MNQVFAAWNKCLCKAPVEIGSSTCSKHHWPSKLLILCFNLSISTKECCCSRRGQRAGLKSGLSSGTWVTQNYHDNPVYKGLDTKKRQRTWEQREETASLGSSRGSCRAGVVAGVSLLSTASCSGSNGEAPGKDQGPAPPQPWAETPPWSAPKVCPTLLQRDKAGWRGWGPGPRCSTFWMVLALAHTGCKVTISEKPDITFTQAARPINARAHLIDRHHHFRKPGEKLPCQVLVWFGFGGGFW